MVQTTLAKSIFTGIRISARGLIYGPLSSLAREPINRGRWAIGQTREEVAQNLAGRWCWQAARRHESRVVRRLCRKHVVDGVYRLDEGALLDAVFYCLQDLGVVDWLGEVQGTATHRERVPCAQYLLLAEYSLLLGVNIKDRPPGLGTRQQILAQYGLTAPH
jgi:hypothetical protein